MGTVSTSAALYVAVTSPSQLLGAQPDEAKELKHHLKNGKGFRNPWDSYQDTIKPKTILAFIWRIISRTGNIPDTTSPAVAVHKPTFLESRQTTALRSTWLGHACYYVEFPGGFRVLFDPVFTERCSPFSFMGPKRYTDIPCQIDHIPFIDAVVISHNHYDHMSHPTIIQIKKQHPNVHFFVPLGNKKWFLDCGIHNVTELDWWESRDLKLSLMESKAKEGSQVSVLEAGRADAMAANGPETMTATIGCLPCQHTSARGPFDKGRTLWASWSVESGGKKVYFAGDTGYRTVPKLPAGYDDYDAKLKLPHCPAFAEIGSLRGPFDLGLIPIGAYEPRFIMSSMHANPKDSVNIFVDTKCRRALGMHWGTWVLTEEDVHEPPRLLKTALKAKNIPETGVFDVCDIGESREFEAL
ncbi:Metallo-hydrolase/oxidoreductase [Lepidopterella palustris CBS 459.81]|uniref:Metallo-hydrolase/oxidoreductase n=1 Tax=Lepidopterella palustris CBS 459.81 TaxID=1314670 RepID=A0A8E2JKY2_9PEZI|nr:Metallo-hydrolase/oxidoreductase [Lepidopterella palustris CBS 459.81]